MAFNSTKLVKHSSRSAVLVQIFLYNNNNNTETTLFMQSHCKSSPRSFDECRIASSDCQYKTKLILLWVHAGCYHLHLPSPFILLLNSKAAIVYCILLYTCNVCPMHKNL